MQLFFTISGQVILPIMLVIAAGAVLHRRFQFDQNTLSKLIFNYYLPAVAFIKMYEANVSSGLVARIIAFLLLQFMLMLAISRIISKLLKFRRELSGSFANSVVLTNCSNIGIPVNDLVFRHDPLAMAMQMIVVLFEIIVTFTVGLFHVGASRNGLKQTLLHFAKMPVLYALLLGLLGNVCNLHLPDFITIPMHNVANGLLSVALVAIGMQVAFGMGRKLSAIVWLSGLLRLVISPLIALLVIWTLGLEGITAQAMLLASSIPTSRNSVSLAMEYNNEPEFAAQTVLLSTLFSPLTLTAAIYASSYLF
jgi:predicted permease